MISKSIAEQLQASDSQICVAPGEGVLATNTGERKRECMEKVRDKLKQAQDERAKKRRLALATPSASA